MGCVDQAFRHTRYRKKFMEDVEAVLLLLVAREEIHAPAEAMVGAAVLFMELGSLAVAGSTEESH